MSGDLKECDGRRLGIWKCLSLEKSTWLTSWYTKSSSCWLWLKQLFWNFYKNFQKSC